LIAQRIIDMDRRSFLSLAAGSLAVSALPFSARAADESLAARFAAARKANPRLAAFDNAPGEFDLGALTQEGRWPAALRGAFFRNGPAQHERAGERYAHWFDGDGMVHRWEIADGRVRYRNRFVATPKRQAEVAAGQFLFPAGGGGIPARAAITGPDSVNVANTSILPVNGELWALWEGGSAMRMDPVSLAAKEFVALSDQLRGAPFSAHPRLGEDGRIWNIGTFGSRVALYRLDARGALEAVKLHRIPPVGFIHDFLLTQRSVVLVLSSTRTEGSMADGMFGTIKGKPDLPMQVLVFDRETLDLRREAQLPPGYVFHFGNAWEEADGTIRFDMVRTNDTNEVQELRKPMRGEWPASVSAMEFVTLPVKGAPGVSALGQRVEFPRVDPRRVARATRYVYTAAFASPETSHWHDAVAKFDTRRGTVQLFAYGDDWMAEEHVFVPRPGGTAEDDGWLLGTALNWKRQQTALSLFDARRPGAGPIARAWLDVPMPLGFHGQFAAA
jgi:all-trans-8'-apo-beta-carotenal 15,15'-oxygenase